LRIKLIQEEFAEVMDAVYYKKDEASILKELCDLVYVCVGFADTFGWNFDVAFNRVHASNMSKLGKDSKPLYRNDGKILKSDQYREPSLKNLT
jgi:predicted HAD superfamily Cof-like phosphohydrolase